MKRRSLLSLFPIPFIGLVSTAKPPEPKYYCLARKDEIYEDEAWKQPTFIHAPYRPHPATYPHCVWATKDEARRELEQLANNLLTEKHLSLHYIDRPEKRELIWSSLDSFTLTEEGHYPITNNPYKSRSTYFIISTDKLTQQQRNRVAIYPLFKED